MQLKSRRGYSVISEARWASFCAAHPPPTFQAGPAWAQALRADDSSLALEPISYTCQGDEFLLPLVRFAGGRLRWRTYCGFPLDGYDVVFNSDGRIARDDQLQAALQRLEDLRFDSLELNLWPLLQAAGPPQWSARRFETSIVDLGEGAEAAFGRMDGRTRRMAGQAERRGVRCFKTPSADTVATYYDLLTLSARRWGRAAPTYSQRFFDALAHFGGEAVEVWLAHFEDKIVAGLVLLYGSEEVNVWSAAMDADYAVLRPHNILHMTAMRAAVERGVRWYNLGSSEGLPGVKRFKEGLGAQTLHYNRLSLEKGVYRSYRALRRALTPGRAPDNA